MICYELNDYVRTSEVNFLWNDDLMSGKPICNDCCKLDLPQKHLNYDYRKYHKPKKRGLDKWLKKK